MQLKRTPRGVGRCQASQQVLTYTAADPGHRDERAALQQMILHHTPVIAADGGGRRGGLRRVVVCDAMQRIARLIAQVAQQSAAERQALACGRDSCVAFPVEFGKRLQIGVPGGTGSAGRRYPRCFVNRICNEDVVASAIGPGLRTVQPGGAGQGTQGGEVMGTVLLPGKLIDMQVHGELRTL